MEESIDSYRSIILDEDGSLSSSERCFNIINWCDFEPGCGVSRKLISRIYIVVLKTNSREYSYISVPFRIDRFFGNNAIKNTVVGKTRGGDILSISCRGGFPIYQNKTYVPKPGNGGQRIQHHTYINGSVRVANIDNI